MLRWLWEHQFAAVAGDAPSFERSPIRGAHANPDVNLHEWVLAGRGCPIGEMFDLEELSKHCKETERYSFFLTSVPLKVSYAVACRTKLIESPRLLVELQVPQMQLQSSELYERQFSGLKSEFHYHTFIVSQSFGSIPEYLRIVSRRT